MISGWKTFLLVCLAAWTCTAPCLAQVPTTTNLYSDQNPADSRASLRVTVSAASGPGPVGTIAIYEGMNQLTTLTHFAGHTDFYEIQYPARSVHVPEIEHTYRAVYTPSNPALWQTSTSPDYVQVDGDPGTSVTRISASANPAGYHQPVTFTARITANLSVGGGVVAWTIDGLSQGTTTVTRVGYAGQASLTLPAGSLSLGSHTVRGDYTDTDRFFRPSFHTLSPNLLVVVEPTTTSLSSSLNPSLVGQAVTLTSIVTGAGSPTGDVTFQVDGSPLGSVGLSSGAAALNVSSLAVGSHNVVVSYPGDATHAASVSTTLIQVVNKITSAIGLASSPNPSTLGDAVTFTATVVGTSPSGTVTFSTGANVLGTSSVTSGQATLTTSTVAVGNNTVTALYNGDANHSAVSTSLTQTVLKRNATVNLTSTVNPSVLGGSATITANVTGAGPTPTGNIVFVIDGTPLMLQNLSGGTTSVALDGLSGGTHTVSANYSGDSEYANATSVLTGGQIVSAASTTATIASSRNPATSGSPITFTANFSASVQAGHPTGQVTFSVNKVAQPPVALVNGTATFTTSALPVGTTPIAVDYPGSSDFLGSSASLNQTTIPLTPAPTPDPTPTPPGEVTSFTLRTITAPPAIQPEQSGQFVIEVSNTGSAADTYRLSLAGSEALTLPLSALQATAGGTAQFLVIVKVPSDAPTGTLASTLTVTSTTNSGVAQSLALTAEVAASTSPRTSQVALQPGWNAVGFPVTQVLTIAPNAQIAGISFYQNGAYDVATLSLAAVTPTTRGYWLFARAATTLEFTGIQPSSGQVSLATGWNLVNFPYSGPLPASRLQFDSALVLAEVNEVQPDSSYRVVRLGSDAVFTPGRPCWVFATAPTEITY